MLRLVPIALALSSFWLSAACGGPAPDTVTISATDQSSGRPPAFVGGEPRLLTPGVGNRVALRYQLTDGEEEPLTMQLILGVTAGMGATTTFVESAPIVFEIDVGSITTRPNGRYTYQIDIRDAELALPEGTPAEMAEAASAEVAHLGAIDAWIEADDRGITRDVRATMPSSLPPRMQTLLGNIRSGLQSIPFPEEPVGIGARWEVRRVVDHQTHDVDQLTTYELVDLVGTRGELRIVIEQSADPQPLRNLPNGAAANLDTYVGHGEGAAIFDLTHVAPIATMSFQSAMHATSAGGASGLTMETLTQIEVRPR